MRRTRGVDRISAVKYPARDGGSVWFSNTYLPYRNDDGEVEGIYTLSTDVSAHHATREQLTKQRAALAHTLRLGTAAELASAWGHEISQPLDVIAGVVSECVDLLCDSEPDTEKLLARLDHGSAAALRAGSIVHRIRSFVRADPPRMSELDLRDVVRDAVRLVHSEVETSDRRLRVELPSASLPILCDRTQVQQARMNLLRNALEAMEDASPDEAIDVAAHQADEFLEVVVRDRGTGVPAEATEWAFESFHTTKPGRLGLGLMMARSIIESHGGSVELGPSADGLGGAVARLRLPAAGEAP